MLMLCSGARDEIRGEHARQRGGGQGAAAPPGGSLVHEIQGKGWRHHQLGGQHQNSPLAIDEPGRLEDCHGSRESINLTSLWPVTSSFSVKLQEGGRDFLAGRSNANNVDLNRYINPFFALWVEIVLVWKGISLIWTAWSSATPRRPTTTSWTTSKGSITGNSQCFTRVN